MDSNNEDDEHNETGASTSKVDHDEDHEDRVFLHNTSRPSVEHMDRRIVRKLDFILLPFLSLFFLVNSLDRSNVGNAETAQFTRDCGLEPDDLNHAVALFFVFFVALQPVGAACGRRFGMRRWVPSCMVIWGVCTALHVWITHKWQLFVLRMLIGILEAGFYPTTVAYLSLFYTRYEFGRRLGVFYGQYAIAGALGGVLSFLVFSRFPVDDGTQTTTSHWRAWQVLFVLEGGLTVFIAAIGFFWLPNSAETAWFLGEEERRRAGYRIWQDRQETQNAEPALGAGPGRQTEPQRFSMDETTEPTMDAGVASVGTEDHEEEEARLLPQTSAQPWAKQAQPASSTHFTVTSGLTVRDVLDAFVDWKVFHLLLVNILSAIPAAAFGVFLPLVVQGLGFQGNAASANLLTAPPFLAGAVVLFVFVWWSDAKRERMQPILYGLGVLLAGLTATVMIPHKLVVLRYLTLCVLLGGSFIASPLTIAWLSGNIEEPGKRSVVLGINGWGNLAGMFSSLLFSKRFAPYYTVPFFVTLACVLCAFVGYMVFRQILIRENRWRASILATWNDADVELERRHGKGPLDTTTALRKKLYRVLLLRQSHSVRDEAESNARRGEEKLTFRFGT